MNTRQLTDRLRAGPPMVLDGAMGTELERRGYRTSLPLWSAMAAIEVPQLVHQIHTDYIEAGADIITANTFRTTDYTLAKEDKAQLAQPLTTLTVELAQEAIAQSGREVLLAGAIAPLEDCYSPDLVPDKKVIHDAYTQQIENLSSAHVDFILAETMINLQEASTLASLVADHHMPFMMSFTADVYGNLLDGTPLSKAVEVVASYHPLALLVNCRPLSYH